MDDELDLTNEHLHSLDNVTLHPDLVAIDLTANRLSQLEPQLLQLQHLTRLSLRQNIVADASGLTECQSKPSLADLELRDNQLSAVPDLTGFSALTRLELSYNELRSLAPLSSLRALQLTELYAANNKITTIESLDAFTALQVLELGFNRIRTMEGLEHQGAMLRELWLGRNRIEAVGDVQHLVHLERLSLQSNRLANVNGLEMLVSLKELYLSHNGIESIAKLAPLINLRVLDVSNNRVRSLAGVEGMQALTDLWLNDNEIGGELDEVVEVLRAACGDTLSCLYLHGNPVAAQGSEESVYRARIVQALPALTQLDADDVPGR